MARAHKTPPPPAVHDLYETDYSRWLRDNARLLREGRLADADIENLAEELEDMERSERRAVASHLTVLLAHLLKWHFQPTGRGGSWRGSIHNARRAIEKRVNESPSLRPLIPELIEDEYPDARFNAANETAMPEERFPETCPYSLEQLMDHGFFPDSEP